MKTKKQTKQQKLELFISLAFTAVMVLLSITNIGYIEIDTYQSINLSIIPAMFAAMIGGYRIVIPVGIIWGLLGYYQLDSNMFHLGLFGSILVSISFLFFTYLFYSQLKKAYKRSPANVYRTIICTIVFKSMIMNTIIVVFYLNGDIISFIRDYYFNSIYLLVVEMTLSMLTMKMVVGHLREIHILNGVKRKNKNGVDKKC